MGASVPRGELFVVSAQLDYLRIYWLQCRRNQVITYQELFYFQQMMGIDLTPWEIEIIIHIDNIYWNLIDGDNRNIDSKSRK